MSKGRGPCSLLPKQDALRKRLRKIRGVDQFKFERFDLIELPRDIDVETTPGVKVSANFK